MKDLLYLKDDHLKEFIEKLFVSYRESFNDAKKTLDKHSLGIAHHKVIHIISINEGITISNLLKKLKITKQSLNRVIKELIKLEIILFKKGEKDTRLKHVYLTKKGMKIFEEIMNSLDRNCNGVIDYTEFLTAAADKEELLCDENLRFAFKMFDED